MEKIGLMVNFSNLKRLIQKLFDLYKNGSKVVEISFLLEQFMNTFGVTIIGDPDDVILEI